jgi:type IV secretory pathway VirB10-like protein
MARGGRGRPRHRRESRELPSRQGTGLMENRTALALACATVMVAGSGAFSVGALTGAIGPDPAGVEPVARPSDAQGLQTPPARTVERPRVERVTRVVDVPVPAPVAGRAVAPVAAAAAPSAASALPAPVASPAAPVPVAGTGAEGTGAAEEQAEERAEAAEEQAEERADAADEQAEALQERREERRDRLEDVRDAREDAADGDDSSGSGSDADGGRGHG